MIVGVIRRTIDNKAAIATESPAKCTAMMAHILTTLTGRTGGDPTGKKL
jgi:hypothetical protein